MGVDLSAVLNESKRAKVGEVWTFNPRHTFYLVLGVYVDVAYDEYVFDCLDLLTGARAINPWSIDKDERWTRVE